jgi:hypothetical protein
MQFFLLVVVMGHICTASLSPDSVEVPFQDADEKGKSPHGKQILSQDVKEQLESELLDSCGPQCVDFMNQFLPLMSDITVPQISTPQEMEQTMKKQFSKFNNFFKNFITNGHVENIKILNAN